MHTNLQLKTAFIIFAHCGVQTVDDVDDLIDNIKHFHNNCDFLINHPNIEHEKIFTRHNLGELNRSSFIYGAFVDIVNKLSYDDIESFDCFYFVSSNQYFMSDIIIKLNVNYFQFYNTPDWTNSYVGKDSDKTVIGNPLIQPYGVWDPDRLCDDLKVPTPMASNWEGAILTKESMKLCKDHIQTSIEKYPNTDLISLFPGYMALLSGQPWEFPEIFCTFDPSNKPEYNKIVTIEQLLTKKGQGYYSVKRVNYNKDCPIKTHIRSLYSK